MRKTSKRSLLALGILTLFMAAATGLQAAYIITSLDYSINPSDPVGKIGDEVLFQMAVLDATTTYSNVSVVVSSISAGSIQVSCANFDAANPPAFFKPYYIYDGVHTWVLTTGFTDPVIKSVTLSDNPAILISGRPVGNYTALQFASFSGANGTMAGGAPAGSAKIDIGTAIYGINIHDDGDSVNHNDASGGDGIYNGRFSVREAYQFNISKGAIVGHFTNVTKAGNDPFISPSKISLDSVRPRVELVNASPNPYNPNNEMAQIFYYLTENSSVQLTILNGINPIKTLTASGYFGYNQPILWDGLDENGVLQTDGDYTYQFDIIDTAGNTGSVFTGILKLTTVEVVTTLYSIDSNYSQSANSEIVVTAKMHAELRHATLPNLKNLGFNAFPQGDFRNYPYIYIDMRIYDSSGGIVTVYPKDMSPNTDMDLYQDPITCGYKGYINLSDPAFNRQFQGYGSPPTGFTLVPLPYCDPCSVNPLTVYTLGDDNKSNDWDNVFGNPLDDQAGGIFTSDPTFVFASGSITPGTYIIAFKGILVGKYIASTSTQVETSALDCTVGTTTVSMKYSFVRYHAAPSYFVDDTLGFIGDERGFGVSSQMRTSSFLVEQNPSVPLPDSMPPTIVLSSEDPSNGTTIDPDVVGPLSPVAVSLTDEGVGAGPVNLSTFVLKDPLGNQVPGKVAWNAGTPGTKKWELYYIPDNNLTVGGQYTFTVVPVDAAYNIGAAKIFTFNVVDMTAPEISKVTLRDQTNSSVELTLSTSSQINFTVTKVECTLASAGSAAVDYANSSMVVSKDDSSGNTITGKYTHAAGSTILRFTPDIPIADGKYKLDVIAVSVNGAKNEETFNFGISTDAVCIDLNGITGTAATDQTYLRMSPRVSLTPGITDGSSNPVLPLDFSVATLNASALLTGSFHILSGAMSVSVTGHTVYPMTFNANICPATIRLHYTDDDVTLGLTPAGLTEADLAPYVYNGSGWTKISGASGPVASDLSNDRYIEFRVSSIPLNNIYALLYLIIPGGGGSVTYNFKNTKIFNPTSQTARIFYTQDYASLLPLGGSGNVKVAIFAINGSPVRTFDFQNKNALFNNGEPNFNNLSEVNYYFTWDGKNDKGKTVLNGIYIIKIEITTAAGVKSRLSRAIAVVK